MPFTLPPDFVLATSHREGDAGRAWLAELPVILAELLRRWDCEPVGEATHGAVGLVVPVRRRGRPAMVKVSYPHPGNSTEWIALAAFDGAGAVRLYDVLPDRFAMLLECVHDETLASLEDVDDVLLAAGEVARQLAVPGQPGLPRLTELADVWAADLAEQHRAAAPGLRLPDRVVFAALETFTALRDDETDSLIHGDLHAGNILRGDRHPWLAIDPKGYVGTACFDAGIVVRHRLLDLAEAADLATELRRRVATFTDAAGVDTDLGLRCTQARFVSSYYWELQQRSPASVVGTMRAAALSTTT